MELRNLEDELRAIGGTMTDLGNFLVPYPTFDVLVRLERRRGVTCLVLYVPIASASERETRRCLEGGTQLLVGVPTVIGDALLVRCVLPIANAARDLRVTIDALAADATTFERTTRRDRPTPATFACFAQ
jgi:hypothetical protein